MNEEKGNILYVDDDKQNLFLFQTTFRDKYRISTAESGSAALQILKTRPFQVILADQRMPEMNGIQLLEQVARVYPEIIRVLVTGYTDIDVVIDAINRGAVYRYISKPWDNEEIINTIANALEIYELKHKNSDLMASLDSQNRLLKRKVNELDFLNAFNLELKEITKFGDTVIRIIKRLQRELSADWGFYCEQNGTTLTYRLPQPAPSQALSIIDYLNDQYQEKPDRPQILQISEQDTLYLLPLNFQELNLGYLLFLYDHHQDGRLDQSDFLFAQAAANVAASNLYSFHFHKEQIEKEKYFILGQMAGMIVHDLKGPLTTIMGFVNLLRDEEGCTKRSDYSSIINKEVNRLIEMIEELLSFSQGKRHLNYSKINLEQFIQEILYLFNVAFENESITVMVEADPGAEILGDRKKLKKVLINLLNNAREALVNKVLSNTCEGPNNRERKIWIQARSLDHTIQINISNNGVSIPLDIAPQLFEPFFTFQKESGTGLGLTICKRIVEEHQGTIQVCPEKERTKFIINLPRAPNADQAN